MNEVWQPDDEQQAPQPEGSTVILDNSNPLFAALTSERQELFRRFDEARQALQSEIAALAQAGEKPSAHGTSSNLLESIFTKGVGAEKPSEALHGINSATAAELPGGMLGAHLFAKGLKGESFAIRREEVDTKDTLGRYVELVPIISEEKLRPQIERYFNTRTQRAGEAFIQSFPALLVMVDKQGIMYSNNPAVPSERRFEGVIPPDQIVMLLVPEANIQEAQELVDRLNLQVSVKAIEAVELY